MHQFAIITNMQKDGELLHTRRLVEAIENNRARALLLPEAAERLGAPGLAVSKSRMADVSDAYLVLGGDGTLLNAVQDAARAEKPILAFNLGRVGFLAEAGVQDIEEVVRALCADDFHIEKRIMLSGRFADEEPMLALNDIVVSRSTLLHTIGVKIEVNGTLADEFRSDGVVIATPTGSTAYALSAGGPVVGPGLDCIVIAPICPHTMHSKPIVVSPSSIIRIYAQDDIAVPHVSVDGQFSLPMRLPALTVERAPVCARLIRLKSRNFYSVLHHKLMEWSGTPQRPT